MAGDRPVFPYHREYVVIIVSVRVVKNFVINRKVRGFSEDGATAWRGGSKFVERKSPRLVTFPLSALAVPANRCTSSLSLSRLFCLTILKSSAKENDLGALRLTPLPMAPLLAFY